MTDLIDPKTIDYPSNREERETYMRLKLAKGQRNLTPIEVSRIMAARQKRASK